MPSTPTLLPPPPRNRVRVPRLLMEMLVALSLASLIWLYTRCRDQETLDMVLVPVQINLAADVSAHYELDIGGSTRIPVSFTGPPSRIRELRGQLQRGTVNIPMTMGVPKNKQEDNVYRENVRVDAGAVPVPPGIVAVIPEGRNLVPVTLYRLGERDLPVRLDSGGDARISKVKLEPSTVVVRGPKAILDRAVALSTQPYAVPAPPDAPLPGAGLQIRGQASLVRELEGRAIQCKTEAVKFQLLYAPPTRMYELADVPVHFLCPPNFAWKPRLAELAKISLRVIGPTGDEHPHVQAFVDLTQGVVEGGRKIAPVRLQLPKDFQLGQETPPRVVFFLDPVN